jgi:CBS domain-containing protein
MIVSSFMVPAAKVIKCVETDTIKTALDLLLNNHISALVVMNNENHPSGIVTKTDLISAYQKGMILDEEVRTIMSTDLKTVCDSQSRDQAARSFAEHHIHHALVMDKDNKFVGFITAWDIANECVKDDRAWPWTRKVPVAFDVLNVPVK